MLPSPQSTVKLPLLATVVLNLICSLADVVSHVVTKSPAGGVGVESANLMIWTASEFTTATAAYGMLPTVNVSIPHALSSRTPEPSAMLSSAVMSAGSVTSIIWTPSSIDPVTAR